MPVPSHEKEHEVVRRILEQLVNDEKIAPSDIAILTPLSLVRGNSYWKPDKTLLGRFRLVHHLNPAPNEIFCSSISAAKGLEFPVVILTELHSPAIKDEVSDYPAYLYVGVSRARSHLVVTGDRQDLERLG